MTETGAMEGVIVKGVGGLYYARDKDGAVSVLRAKGKFRKQHITPMVGDQVLYTAGANDEHGWVDEILPRSSVL
ncbi:MAG: ribosome small subunit-dependent GTPase A, partial [Clostridia bacterium]